MHGLCTANTRVENLPQILDSTQLTKMFHALNFKLGLAKHNEYTVNWDGRWQNDKLNKWHSTKNGLPGSSLWKDEVRFSDLKGWARYIRSLEMVDTLTNNLSLSFYLLRRWRTNVKCLVSDGDMTRRFVSVTVNRDGPDTQLLCGFHNPASYLATVGDQHL